MCSKLKLILACSSSTFRLFFIDIALKVYSKMPMFRFQELVIKIQKFAAMILGDNSDLVTS